MRTRSTGYTYTLYDGDTPVCALDSSGNVTSTVTMGPTGLANLHTTASGGSEFINDPRGNTVATVNASGNVLATLPALDAFGVSGSNVAGALDNQHTYPTEQFGTGANSLALGFREYDMSTGRFLKRDPMGYSGGINLYSYTQNNPVNRNDPLGLQSPDNNDSMAVIGDNIDHTTFGDALAQFQDSSLYKSLVVSGTIITSLPDPANPFFDFKVGEEVYAGGELAVNIVARKGVGIAIRASTADTALRASQIFQGRVYAATLVPGVSGTMKDGSLLVGKEITCGEAIDRIKRGGNVFADSMKLAKSLAKSASGRNKAIGPEGIGKVEEGYYPHFHPHPRNGSHVYFP